nr:MAG TPA: hypothetical protein [Caudoviricetes sp.]
MKEIIISLGCAAISGIVAWVVAKQAAKAEIKKLQTIWAHEKETACDADFDKMVSTVSLYAKYPSPNGFHDATDAVSIYRAKATGEIAVEVDKLSGLIERFTPNCDAILT